MVQRPHKTQILGRTRRTVVKVGSNTLSSTDGIRRESISRLARALVRPIASSCSVSGWPLSVSSMRGAQKSQGVIGMVLLVRHEAQNWNDWKSPLPILSRR